MVPGSFPKIVYDDGGVVLGEQYRLQNARHAEPSVDKHDVRIRVILGHARVIWPRVHKFSVRWMSPFLQLPHVHVDGREILLPSQGSHPTFNFAKPFRRAVHGHNGHVRLLGHDFRASTASKFQVLFGGWIGHHAGEELNVQLAGVHGHGLGIAILRFTRQGTRPRRTPQEEDDRSCACPFFSFRCWIHGFPRLSNDSTLRCV